MLAEVHGEVLIGYELVVVDGLPNVVAHHNRRRAHDPLGQGQPCTWRTRLIKVAALVYESTRRVVVRLSASWPYLGHYEYVSQRVLMVHQASLDTG